MLKIPANASPEIQQAFRDVWQAIEHTNGKNVDMKGTRLINAGSAQGEQDYVIKQDVAALAKQAGTNDNPVFTSLTVRQLSRLLGVIELPQFSDGTKHHAILFVDSNGQLAVNEDGAAALDLNIQDLKLEIGYGLTIYWFNQAGLGSPAVDVVNVTDNAGGTALLRFVLGLDNGTGIALRKNGTTLEIRVGGGGGYTALDAGSYKVNAHAGVDFGPGAIASITIEKGIVTAAS